MSKTYRELLTYLQTLSEEQLDYNVTFCILDEGKDEVSLHNVQDLLIAEDVESSDLVEFVDDNVDLPILLKFDEL